MNSEPRKNVLLTGDPACGKTTLVRRVIEQLSDLRLAGFYTREIRRQGKRLGFEAVGLSGSRAVLAHVVFRSGLRVGRYGVQLEQFDELIHEELRRPPDEVDLYVIDEIGKMECYSDRFVQTVQTLLDGPLPLLGTVGQRGRGFIEQVKRRSDVRVVLVTAENREQLVKGIANQLRRQSGARGSSAP